MLGYITAALSGATHGAMNVTDKFVVSHKVKKPYGYAIFVGAFNLLLGLIISLFLNWQNILLEDLLLPIVVGILYGSGTYVYYNIMSKEDASHSVGLMYLYPLVVAFLSFTFLDERLHGMQYIGVIITIIGATFLSVRLNEIKLKASIWGIVLIILVAALTEFIIKISSDTMSALNGSSVTYISFGATILLGLLSKKVRTHAVSEILNAKWTLVTESLNYIGTFFLYVSMALLPATIVSSVCATQPLFCLIFEKIFHKKFRKMARDEEFGKKAIAISCIVFGIILMYVFS